MMRIIQTIVVRPKMLMIEVHVNSKIQIVMEFMKTVVSK